ncbi:MAG TPA: hypothetical protein VFF86_09355 [Candidatus Methylomirabilis sp.]|nr:hypothetical protein [Candidatus Methylomirabilis sp.]
MPRDLNAIAVWLSYGEVVAEHMEWKRGNKKRSILDRVFRLLGIFF